jgi:ABC-2 type transport system permease protein
MSAAATTIERAAAAPARRRLSRIYWLEARSEALKVLRLPAYLAPMFAFPAMFYLLFAVAMQQGGAKLGQVSLAAYLLATYGVWGVMNVSLFGFGVGVAAERGQGWLLLKRATPMPPLANLVGRLATSSLFCVGVVLTLFALGLGPGHVRMPAATFLELGAVLVAGALPFAAFGLAVGYWAGPNSAAMVCNLLSLPMSFASGLWIPYALLPPLVRKLALGLPAYHYAQLALGVLGAGNRQPIAWSLLYLAVFTAAMLLLARMGYLRDEGRTFG